MLARQQFQQAYNGNSAMLFTPVSIGWGKKDSVSYQISKNNSNNRFDVHVIDQSTLKPLPKSCRSFRTKARAIAYTKQLP